MLTHHIWYSTVISDDETYIYEDKKTGIVFTSIGSIPDGDEIEHVEKYHAGEYCPIGSKHGRVSRCADIIAALGAENLCHYPPRVGTW